MPQFEFQQLSAFASGVVKQFAETPLLGLAVKGFAYGLPFVEGLVGLLLAFGVADSASVGARKPRK